jgi:hypothetical protein
MGHTSLTGRRTSQRNKKIKTPPPAEKNEFLWQSHKRHIWGCHQATKPKQWQPQKSHFSQALTYDVLDKILTSTTQNISKNNTLLFVNKMYLQQRDCSAIFSLFYGGKMTVIQAVKK